MLRHQSILPNAFAAIRKMKIAKMVAAKATGGRRRHRRHRMRLRGGALPAWISKVHSYVKKHKLISRVGRSLASANVPYAKTVSNVASKLGYGRRRHRRHHLRY